MNDPLPINLNSREELAMAVPRFAILAGEIADRGGEAFIFGKFGLNVAKYSLLKSLSVCPVPLSMSTLREMIFIQRSASNVTQLVDDLEKRGLVKRIADPKDRRVTLVEILPDGRTIILQADEQYLKFMLDFLQSYSTNELRDCVIVLKKFFLATAAALGINMPKLSRDFAGSDGDDFSEPFTKPE